MAGVIAFLTENWVPLLAAIEALLGAIIAICMLIPGPQPEQFLQSVLDVLTKFSRKPKE